MNCFLFSAYLWTLLSRLRIYIISLDINLFDCIPKNIIFYCLLYASPVDFSTARDTIPKCPLPNSLMIVYLDRRGSWLVDEERWIKSYSSIASRSNRFVKRNNKSWKIYLNSWFFWHLLYTQQCNSQEYSVEGLESTHFPSSFFSFLFSIHFLIMWICSSPIVGGSHKFHLCSCPSRRFHLCTLDHSLSL